MYFEEFVLFGPNILEFLLLPFWAICVNIFLASCVKLLRGSVS